MFGRFYFGGFYFGDAEGFLGPIPIPSNPTRIVATVPCLVCKSVPCSPISELSLYNLQNGQVLRTNDDPIPECIECFSETCDPGSDLIRYNIQSGLVFTNSPFGIVVPCPAGRDCGPQYPIFVDIPPDIFDLPIPQPPPGEDYMARLQCCQSEITRIVPAGSSQAAIQAVVDQMFYECAQQQALCDAEEEFPTTPQVFTNAAVYFVVDCAVDTTLTFSGTLPTGMSIDTANDRVVLAAGVIVGFTQEEATATAQAFLNGFCEAAIIAGTLTCESIGPCTNIFDDIVWTTVNAFGGITSILNAVGADVDWEMEGIPAVQNAVIELAGSFTYTGDLVNCEIQFDGDAWVGPEAENLNLEIMVDAIPVLSLNNLDIATMPVSIPFTIPASTGAVVTIFGSLLGTTLAVTQNVRANTMFLTSCP